MAGGGPTVDVYLDGCRDPSPASRRGVVLRLAERFRLSPPELEARMAKGRFCCFRGLPQAHAEQLKRDLELLGARISLVPAAPPPPSPQVVSLDEVGPAAPAARRPSRPPAMPPPATREPSLDLVSLDGEEARPPSRVPPAASGPRAPVAPGADPFAPPPLDAGAPIELDPRASAPRASGPHRGPLAGQSHPRTSAPRAPAPHAGPELALETAEERRRRVAGADPNTVFGGDVLAASANRLPEAADAPLPRVQRCEQHGLLFDPSQATGCRRCRLAAEAQLEAGRRWLFAGGRLRAQPGRRALLGMVFALGVGLLPAGWYIHNLHTGSMQVLEDERAALAADPRLAVEGNGLREKITALGDDIDSQQSHGLLVGIGLWAVVAAAAAAMFFRFT